MEPETPETRTPSARSEQPLPELVDRLVQESTHILRDHLEQARSEISDEMGRLRESTRNVALGGAILLAGSLVLLRGAVLTFDRITGKPWLASILIGGAMAGIGTELVSRGGRRLRAELSTTRTGRR